MKLKPKIETKEELKNKIRFLQKELVKKNIIIEKLKEENKTILQTAIKNARKKLKF